MLPKISSKLNRMWQELAEAGMERVGLGPCFHYSASFCVVERVYCLGLQVFRLNRKSSSSVLLLFPTKDDVA